MKIIIDPAGGLFDRAALVGIRAWVLRDLTLSYDYAPTVANVAAAWGTSRARVYRILDALGIERPRKQRQPQ